VKFDLIYSNHVFEHVNNPHEYLSNCREMLGENGSIICAIPDIYNSHTHIFPNSNFKPMFHIAHIYNYSMSCLETMAKKLGMEIQRLAPDPSIRTATSDMPELWFRMQTNENRHSQARSEKRDYLKYFKTVEQNFLNGTNLLAAKPTGGRIKTLIKKIIKWKK
jgi:2-polyprenyl-3-methyl-5-hydroxy-6-metoxy-1,4-benzoquinol methylase